MLPTVRRSTTPKEPTRPPARRQQDQPTHNPHNAQQTRPEDSTRRQHHNHSEEVSLWPWTPWISGSMKFQRSGVPVADLQVLGWVPGRRRRAVPRQPRHFVTARRCNWRAVSGCWADGGQREGPAVASGGRRVPRLRRGGAARGEGSALVSRGSAGLRAGSVPQRSRRSMAGGG